MRVGKNKSTMKQMAYARKVWGAQGLTKKEIALDCGYSTNVANSVASHIEAKPGFQVAMSALAVESNNLALSVLYEFKRRGFDDFTNKDLVGALNAIGNAWSKFASPDKSSGRKDQPVNRLRTVILQQVENQVVNNPEPLAPPEPVSVVDTEQQYDF